MVNISQKKAIAPERPRLNPSDWESAALDVIAASGVNAVLVEPLARMLGVTKGSFYWHFSGRPALIRAALERWEQDDIHGVMGSILEIRDPRERLRQAFIRTSENRRSHAVHSALFLSPKHSEVEPVLRRVSERRMAYLTSAFIELGMRKDQAQHRARLTYSGYVGFLQMAEQMHSAGLNMEEYEQFVQHLIDTLIP